MLYAAGVPNRAAMKSQPQVGRVAQITYNKGNANSSLQHFDSMGACIPQNFQILFFDSCRTSPGDGSGNLNFSL
jgi:hypothetical protein